MTGAEIFLDAGQSAVKIRSLSEEGVTTLSLTRVDTSRAIAPQIVFAATQFAEQTGIHPWRMTVSSTALTHPAQTAQDILSGVRTMGVETVLLAHDSIGGYLSAIGSEFGAVAAVGTGVVTLGVGPAGYARVDGWGNLIGDAGSGYWIGRLALESAMRAHDGRGQTTALHEVMLDQFPNIEDAYLELQTDPERIFRIASFAKPTIELSVSDSVARDIVDRATDELVISMGAALRRAGFTPDDSPTMSWTGSVASNPVVSDLLTSKLLIAWPSAQVVPPEGEPIDGVQLMSTLTSEHPLAEHIVRVSVREDASGLT